MTRPLAVLGIDLGTSGVKVLAVGHRTDDDGTRDDGTRDDGALDGRVLGRGRAEYPVLVPSAGRAESDPGDWWRSTCRAVRQAVAQTADAEIVGLAGTRSASTPTPPRTTRTCARWSWRR